MNPTELACADYISQHCFRGDARSPRTIGAELEYLVLNTETGRPHHLDGSNGTFELLRALAPSFGWQEQRSQHKIPRFHTATGGVITFEPGGQIEYSSAPFRSATQMLRDVEHHSAALEAVFQEHGITLHSLGVDPFNTIDAVPLQLDSARYVNMTRYFAQIGPAGERMMRQTAALQVNISASSDAMQRWRLLNRLAPVLIALFANSRCYGGVDSGHASYRAQTWREADPARTGVFPGEDPVHEYTRFALSAPDLLHPNANNEYRLLSEQTRAFDPTILADHLTTLFPEVRPRGWFEIRSCDAQPAQTLAAPIVLIAGIVLDERAADAAFELLPVASEASLHAAGRLGITAPSLQPVFADLVDLAIGGCRRLGGFLEDPDLERAQDLLRARLQPIAELQL